MNMVVPQLLLDRLPVELIFNIFNYLTAIEILHSFYSFSQYLRQCIRKYQQYKINFQTIHKHEFDWICNVIHPDQIMTLTLSDSEETPGQMDLFFSCFATFDQSFTRLKHLRLRNPEEFPNLSQMKCLHTLTIDFKRWAIYSFDYEHIRRYDKYLANIFRLPTLRTLILNNESLNIDFNFQLLPIAEHLHTFQVHLKSIDNLPFIFKCLPNIKRLSLSLKTRSMDNNFISELNVPCSLTHLTIKLSHILRDEIGQIIQACSMLIYLNIHIERNQTNFHQWLDSDWWPLLIDKCLPQLKIFRLR
ncbi:unnamed protein product, partial [Rotaria sp. Silwood1]